MEDVEEKEVSEEEWELIEKHRKKTAEKPAEKPAEPKKEPKKEKAEDFEEKHDEDYTDLIDKTEYHVCAECGFDKLTKDMKNCPNCDGELDWQSL